jgi:beta-alanine--pyruvate transaminase
MGGVVVSSDMYQAFMGGPATAIEFAHGYTYSAHALACAAGIATLQLYKDEDLFARAAKIAKVLDDGVHSLKGSPHVIDIRCHGLVAGVELATRGTTVGARGFDTFLRCYQKGILIRQTGDIMAIAPPLIIDEKQIAQIVDTLREVLRTID